MWTNRVHIPISSTGPYRKSLSTGVQQRSLSRNGMRLLEGQVVARPSSSQGVTLPDHSSSPVLLVYGWTREGLSYIHIFLYIYIYMNVCVRMPLCMYVCVCIYTHIQIYSTTIWFNWARFCSCFVWKTIITDLSALTCLEWNIICPVKTLNIAFLK